MEVQHATAPNPIWTDVDFEKDGKQAGFLRLPNSTDVSAYGWIPIPICCVRKGVGPRVLLVAGNHGDEYEGQIALMNLARELEPEMVSGRIIIMPAANFPAVRSGRRNSPLDNGNLNRSFPGNPFGTPTQTIAHYIDTVLLADADFAVDLHSGGYSLEYVPCGLIRPGKTEEERRMLLEALCVFGAPIGYVSSGRGGGGSLTLSASAARHDVVTVTAELGGGATFSERGLKIAEQGVRRLLKHFGSLPEGDALDPPDCRLMEVRNLDYFVYSPEDGVFEPLVQIGDEVEVNQPAAKIHFPDTPWREPELVLFKIGGFVVCRRVPCHTARGDCLFQLLTDLQPD